VVKRGKTPVLTSDQARALIESIDTSMLVGLRDRALIGVMTYAFARVGAVVAMRVEDYFANGKRWWVRLREKGGKRHEMPAHHKLEAFLDEYIRAAGISDEAKSPLFRSALGRTGLLNGEAMHRIDAYRMIQRRAAEIRAPLRHHQAMDEPGRLPDEGPLKRARRVLPHGTRLQSVTGAQHPRRRDHDGGSPGRETADKRGLLKTSGARRWSHTFLRT
jgi:integrase